MLSECILAVVRYIDKWIQYSHLTFIYAALSAAAAAYISLQSD